MRNSKTYDVVVIGGGAAGMMAAITAAKCASSTLLIEKNRFTGKKLAITGKGRCNITNNSSPETIIKNTPRNGKFLFSCLNRFTPADTISFFEDGGLPLTTERGNRVFPTSNQSADVNKMLRGQLEHYNVDILYSPALDIIVTDSSVSGVRTAKGHISCKAMVLATGGLSYPLTGSTGDGYTFAEKLGHRIIGQRASIVPLESDDADCKKMQGLSLRNVGVKVYTSQNKLVFEDFGELLFTHYGVSGPVVLSMSAHLRDFENERYHISIDLKPALDDQKLDKRILRDFLKYKNREFGNSLGDLLHKSMIDVIIDRTGIDPKKPTNSVSKEERRRLLEIVKNFKIPISGTRPIDEAVITSGGVDIREINPVTLQSKLIKGLFFAGEIIDVDAYTGGFNLQIAWSTGYAAGIGSSEYQK